MFTSEVNRLQIVTDTNRKRKYSPSGIFLMDIFMAENYGVMNGNHVKLPENPDLP